MKKTCYFAHSRLQYGFVVEREAMELIKDKFPGYKIFNPGSDRNQRDFMRGLNPYAPVMEYMQVFFRRIDECEFLVFMTQENGMLGRGTAEEIKYALGCNKDVFCIELPVNVCKITENDIIEIHTRGGKKDWRSNWAKVKDKNENKPEK